MEYKVITLIPGQLGGKCGFCAFGEAHEYCPSATLDGSGTRALRCQCGCPRSLQIRCFTCGLREDTPTEIDPLTWRCSDQDACAARIEARLALNPAIMQMRSIRAELGLSEDDRAPRGRRERAPRPESTGKCIHCGEPTKGGRFLPGHDAAWLSSMVKSASDDPEFDLDETRALIASISEALLGKFDKRVKAAWEV